MNKILRIINYKLLEASTIKYNYYNYLITISQQEQMIIVNKYNNLIEEHKDMPY